MKIAETFMGVAGTFTGVKDSYLDPGKYNFMSSLKEHSNRSPSQRLFGANNLNSIFKLNENNYHFNGSSSPVAQGKQYIEEFAKICLKWATIAGTVNQLTNDLGLSLPAEPLTPLGIVQTLGSYPYSAIKYVTSGLTAFASESVFSLIRSENKTLLATNTAVAVSSAISLKAIIKHFASIDALTHNSKISGREKVLRGTASVVNIGLAAALPALAYMAATPQETALLIAAGIINEFIVGSHDKFKFAKPLLQAALIAIPVYSKVESYLGGFDFMGWFGNSSAIVNATNATNATFAPPPKITIILP